MGYQLPALLETEALGVALVVLGQKVQQPLVKGLMEDKIQVHPVAGAAEVEVPWREGRPLAETVALPGVMELLIVFQECL